MQPRDVPAVRALFRDTIALGRPLPFRTVGMHRYEALCLDWYLHPARLDDHAVLVDDADDVCGYVLVCMDDAGYRAWATHAAVRWVIATTGALAARRFGAEEARFHRLRLADGWSTACSARRPATPPAHAHLNLAPAVRGRMRALALIAHIDQRCAAAGLDGWYGEINAPVGRRAAAMEAHGAEVVSRRPNRTLSWLYGAPVERLTVVRRRAKARRR